MININDLISNPELYEDVKEGDIENLALQLIPTFSEKISNTADYLSKKLMATPEKSSKAAFEYKIKENIKNSIYTFVAKKRWKAGVPINAYLSKSLYMFSKILIEQNEGNNKKVKIYVCPACKNGKFREILDKSDDTFYCKNCLNELTAPNLSTDFINFYKSFSEHSLKGVKCPECENFVPISVKTDDSFMCPYPNCHADCSKAIDLKHPASLINRTFVSMNNTMKTSGAAGDFGSFKAQEFSEQICGTEKSAIENLINEQEFINDYANIMEIIELQKKTHGFLRAFPNKSSMYESFASILRKHPEEMIKYLTIGGQNADISIQAILYQEFAKIMQEKLPLKFYANGNEVNITDPTDEKLHLFSGIREFVNFIDQNSVVKRRPGYKYIENIKTEDSDDSFIAQIIKITNLAGENITQYVDSYNFTSIRFIYNDKVRPGKDVFVKYYSILPNYTLGSLIHLQRIKRKISDSINKKNNSL